MKIILIIFSLVFVCSLKAQETTRTLKDFETDGCTMFIDGPPSNPTLWRHCCFEHDLRYWFGGTTEDREFATMELHSCVEKVAGSFWADLMYEGIEAGGLSPFKHKYRWGWAWTPERDQSELTPSEVDYVIKRLNDVELDPTYREEFIKKYLGVDSRK
jgi:hypothetical protein